MNVYLLLVDCVFKVSKKKEKHLKGFVIYALNLVCYLYKCVHLFGSEFSGGRWSKLGSIEENKKKKDKKDFVSFTQT